jgi:hypothetical protein
LCGAVIWALQKVDKKTSGNFRWRRMEKISWTDRVRNEEIIQSQGGEEYHTKNKKKEV